LTQYIYIYIYIYILRLDRASSSIYLSVFVLWKWTLQKTLTSAQCWNSLVVILFKISNGATSTKKKRLPRVRYLCHYFVPIFSTCYSLHNLTPPPPSLLPLSHRSNLFFIFGYYLTFTMRKSLCPPVFLNNVPLPVTDKVKYLGLYIDKKTDLGTRTPD
jgi:hypothetical protein